MSAVTPAAGVVECRWRPALLAAGVLGGLAWLGTWFVPPTRAAWDALDVALFRALDASLGWGEPWTVLWAGLNTRALDLVAAGFFAVVFLAWALRAGRAGLAERLAAGAFVAGYVSALLYASSHHVFVFDRPSPTLAVDGARRLSELVPWIDHKDWSGKSFPGDHGTAVFVFTATIWRLAGRGHGVVALAGAIVFSLPRLVSGAHWASDLLAGSAAVAAIALGVALGTPLLALAQRALAAPIEWVLALAERALGRRAGRRAAARARR